MSFALRPSMWPRLHRLDGIVKIVRQNVVKDNDQFDGAGITHRCLLICEFGPVGFHLFEFELELVTLSSELICCCSSGSWRKAKST